MAKDKRPIAVQVEELTSEQRKSIPRIALYHTIVSVLIAVLVVIFAMVPMFAALADYQDAVDDYGDAVDEWTETGDELEKIYGTSYVFSDVYMALKDDVDEMEEEMVEAKAVSDSKMMIAFIAMGAFVIIEVIITVYVYKKYPYYSDRKCFYILRHRKELG